MAKLTHLFPLPGYDPSAVADIDDGGLAVAR
jgi:hypothetical protein